MSKAITTLLKLLMVVFAITSFGTLIIGFTQPVDTVGQKAVYLGATLALMGLTYGCWRLSAEPRSQL